MYITISPQKLSGTFSLSVADFVNYLEKENLATTTPNEFFFNQYAEEIDPETVISEIDTNTAKLKKTEPRYYSIITNPSQRELQHLNNCPRKLRAYTS